MIVRPVPDGVPSARRVAGGHHGRQSSRGDGLGAVHGGGSVVTYVPDRAVTSSGLDFDPQAGLEQAGRRPALVLTPAAYHPQVWPGPVLSADHTRQGLPVRGSRSDGLGVSGVVLADQVRSLDWQKRRAEFLCRLPQAITDAVRQRLSRLI